MKSNSNTSSWDPDSGPASSVSVVTWTSTGHIILWVCGVQTQQAARPEAVCSLGSPTLQSKKMKANQAYLGESLEQSLTHILDPIHSQTNSAMRQANFNEVWFQSVPTNQSFQHSHSRPSASNNKHFDHHGIVNTHCYTTKKGTTVFFVSPAWWQTSVASHSLIAQLTQYFLKLDSQMGRRH